MTAPRTRGEGSTPPAWRQAAPRPRGDGPFVELRERQRHDHSSRRIIVEHALADHKRWKQFQHWTHRRDCLPDTYQAIATLVSDRTATA